MAGRKTAKLTEAQILAWADAHKKRTGRRPNAGSGAVLGAALETWAALDVVLRHGGRGLPVGSSLARLLEERRAVPRRWVRGVPTSRGEPWTAREDELVRTIPPKGAAKRTGRSLAAVYNRRRVLGLPGRT